jgi:hypothetical protein
LEAVLQQLLPQQQPPLLLLQLLLGCGTCCVRCGCLCGCFVAVLLAPGTAQHLALVCIGHLVNSTSTGSKAANANHA